MLQQVFEGLIVNIIKTRQHRVDCCPAAAATLQSQSVRSGIQKVASSLINMAQIFQLRAQRGFNSIVLLCKNVFRLIYHLLQINCGDAAYVYIQNCNISPLQIFRPWSICLTSLKQPHVGRTLGRGIQKGIIFLLRCSCYCFYREKDYHKRVDWFGKWQSRHFPRHCSITSWIIAPPLHYEKKKTVCN